MARRTKEDAIATRNSLIDAAERVFCEKGVARASLSGPLMASVPVLSVWHALHRCRVLATVSCWSNKNVGLASTPQAVTPR